MSRGLELRHRRGEVELQTGELGGGSRVVRDELDRAAERRGGGVPPAQLLQGDARPVVRRVMARIQLQRRLIRLDDVVPALQPQQCYSQPIVRVVPIGIQRDRLSVRGHRLFPTLQLQQGDPQERVRIGRGGIKGDRALRHVGRFLPARQLQERHRQVVVRFPVVGGQFSRAAEQERGRPPPLIPEQQGPALEGHAMAHRIERHADFTSTMVASSSPLRCC